MKTKVRTVTKLDISTQTEDVSETKTRKDYELSSILASECLHSARDYPRQIESP